MDRLKKLVTSKAGTAVSFTLAAALLLFGSVGGARAALTYVSEDYASQVDMKDIGVTLMENGNEISTRDYFYDKADGTWDEHTGILLANMLTDENGRSQQLVFNKGYKEELAVKNSGTIDTYVRVTIYKYWLTDKDKDGNILRTMVKANDMDPELIQLRLANLTTQSEGDKCWIVDEDSSTVERTVLYYNKVLPAGATTPVLSDFISIDGDVTSHVTTYKTSSSTVDEFGDLKSIQTYEYSVCDYNGRKFVVEATVDSVQDHNAEAAILSAWGKNVSTDENGTLSLLK